MKKGRHWLTISFALLLAMGVNTLQPSSSLNASDEEFETPDTIEEANVEKEEPTEVEPSQTPDNPDDGTGEEGKGDPDDHFEIEYDEEVERFDEKEYPLVINYVDEQGNAIADPYSANVKYDTPYEVTTPSIEGYTLQDASQTTISGQMVKGGITYTVIFTKNEEEQPEQDKKEVVEQPVQPPKQQTTTQKVIEILTMPISELVKPESERVVDEKTPLGQIREKKYTQINLMTIIVVGILVLMFFMI